MQTFEELIREFLADEGGSLPPGEKEFFDSLTTSPELKSQFLDRVIEVVLASPELQAEYIRQAKEQGLL